MVEGIDLNDHVAHLIRRVQQLHVNLWLSRVSADVTSPQFAVLNTLARHPQIDQKTLAKMASLDRSTVADVVLRLVRKGYLTRSRDPEDGRRNVLLLTSAGHDVLRPLVLASQAMSEELLRPLGTPQREQLKELLTTVLDHADRDSAG